MSPTRIKRQCALVLAVRVVDLPRATRSSLTPPSYPRQMAVTSAMPMIAAPFVLATMAARSSSMRQRARWAVRQTALSHEAPRLASQGLLSLGCKRFAFLWHSARRVLVMKAAA